MEVFVSPQEMLTELLRTQRLSLSPAPMYIYKPRNDGSGVALKANLRLEPQYESEEDGAEYIKDVDGGLFLEITDQDGKDPKGYPKFAWTKDDRKVTAKMGLADQLALLTAIREVRVAGNAVPTALRPRQGNNLEHTVSLFHQFKATNTTTAINYAFGAEQSHIGISKSRTQRKSIALTLMEELQFQKYLELSLEAYIKLGLR